MIHLEGNNGPVPDERDSSATHVVGAVPEDLVGVFYRNGPNPRSGWSPHMFAGDGMVHALELPSGRYRNRYVRTPLYAAPGTRRDGQLVTTANTHVIDLDGSLLALEEGGVPYELTSALDTVGPFTFGGALAGAFTAHPKRCPTTGDLLAFGYSPRRPFLTYHRWSAGRLTSQPVELPCCTMMHDFAVTATRVVFFDSPFVLAGSDGSVESVGSHGSPWRWDAEHPARIGVMDRDGGHLHWTEIEPGHLSHSANAYDHGDGIVVEGTRIDGPTGLPVMHEWRIDPTGRVTERSLDDISTEYPRIADTHLGRPHRTTYTSSFFYEAEPHHGQINKHHGDTRTSRPLPAGWTCGEPVFVARPDATSEDDGHLLTFAHDRTSATSALLVLDARTLDTEAKVHLPLRVPGGFHGSWVPNARL
jgi:carotenoid cleavage dioxygenase-like enzyme